MRTSFLERAGFFLSLIVLAFLWGFLTRELRLFPTSQIMRAMDQAAHLFARPEFVVPRVYQREGVRTLEPGETQPGLTLIAGMWKDAGDWAPGLKLIEGGGDVLHEWLLDPSRLFRDSDDRREGDRRHRIVHGFHLFANGDVLVNVDYVGTVRLDACGRVLWKLPAGSHHSVHPADDGTFWIPGVTRKSPASTPTHPDGFPGFDGPIHQDQMLRVAADGSVLDTIYVLDVLYDNGLERHMWTRHQSNWEDPTHLNDIEPLSASEAPQYPGFDAGDLLISLRDLDLVLVVDPASRRVEWHASGQFTEQHDPDFLGDGWIGVFDNNPDGSKRGQILGGSRIVGVEPQTDSTTVLFPTAQSDRFFTDLQGKWQRLDNGNVLLTESQAGRIVEVAADGRTVWEWIAEPYDESSVPSVSEGKRLNLSPRDLAAWPCSRMDVEPRRQEEPTS